MSARQLTVATLQTMTEEQQRAHWRALVERWHQNAQREMDADCEFDRSAERQWWE